MRYRATSMVLLAAVALAATLSSASSAQAQVRVAAEAIAGKPFGVGRLTVDLPGPMLPEPLGAESLWLSEADGRALYPAIGKPPLGGFFADLVGAPQRFSVYFLFRGDGPLRLTLHARSARTVTVAPRSDPAAHGPLLQAWWTQYTAPPGLLQTKPDYPPLVDDYLTATLSKRLGLQLPEAAQLEPWQEQLAGELGLTLGTESIHLAMQQARILGTHDLKGAADQPLPVPIAPVDAAVPPTPADVAVEPIALRVPEECFYVRFANFANFLWFQDFLAQWGGDLQNLVATRGLDEGIGSKIEQTLVLKQTDLSRLLGGTVIADVAMIGTDTFFREGASFGMLFHARNNAMLAADFTRQRLARLAAGGVKEEKITLDGHEVSRLTSDDGRVRSYYAADGDFHFVATSETLVKRFLATAREGGAALGSTPAFRHARTVMPLDRQDTVFLYLSEAFFRNFTSPHYRIEMARRLQAAADISLVRLARLAAVAEGKPADTIQQLRTGQLLPADFFRPRPDGSQTVLGSSGVYDRVRGRSGAFVPIPDVPVERVTRAEASAYGEFARFYAEQWGGRMDPTLVGIKREALANGQDRVVIDALVSPLAKAHFESLSQWAGPPSDRQLAPIQGDLATGELVLKGQVLFAGMPASPPPRQSSALDLVLLDPIRDLLVGYVGTNGPLGPLSLLDIQILQSPDANGYSSNVLGLWRRRTGPYTVYSLQPEVLAKVTPQLKFQETPRPAQLRLHVGDPSAVAMAGFLNQLGYARTRETSLGNLRLIGDVQQQLQVPTRMCRDVAEQLIGAKLICPLGGQYVLDETAGGRWTSTALKASGAGGPPPGYQAPPLNWFRGLQLEASLTEGTLSAHAEILMQSPPPKPEADE